MAVATRSIDDGTTTRTGPYPSPSPGRSRGNGSLEPRRSRPHGVPCHWSGDNCRDDKRPRQIEAFVRDSRYRACTPPTGRPASRRRGIGREQNLYTVRYYAKDKIFIIFSAPGIDLDRSILDRTSDWILRGLATAIRSGLATVITRDERTYLPAVERPLHPLYERLYP
jgi:hypothetical protein